MLQPDGAGKVEKKTFHLHTIVRETATQAKEKSDDLIATFLENAAFRFEDIWKNGGLRFTIPEPRKAIQ